jgi:hypothetical protein
MAAKRNSQPFSRSGIVERGGKLMKTRNLFLSGALLAGLAISGVTIAQNVDPGRHPNLAKAQELIDRAIDRVSDAQQANEYDMGGHAAKAKELLMRAREEIKIAAMEANHHRH